MAAPSIEDSSKQGHEAKWPSKVAVETTFLLTFYNLGEQSILATSKAVKTTRAQGEGHRRKLSPQRSV
jgi:hypothetical protein